jgi:hypothetical protein
MLLGVKENQSDGESVTKENGKVLWREKRRKKMEKAGCP